MGDERICCMTVILAWEVILIPLRLGVRVDWIQKLETGICFRAIGSSRHYWVRQVAHHKPLRESMSQGVWAAYDGSISKQKQN